LFLLTFFATLGSGNGIGSPERTPQSSSPVPARQFSALVTVLVTFHRIGARCCAMSDRIGLTNLYTIQDRGDSSI